jgi:hypothetical protein
MEVLDPILLIAGLERVEIGSPRKPKLLSHWKTFVGCERESMPARLR